MISHPYSRRCVRSARRAGFSLLELLVVISIMGLLAAMVIMGARYAAMKASRDRTQAFHRAIISGLTNYEQENHEYPEPADKGKTSDFGKNEYDISGAIMLYQALSGDGQNAIKSSSSRRSPSDGKVEDDEIPNIMLKEMPREMISEGNTNEYMLIDGFSHPFQYTYPERRAGAKAGSPSSNTINNTYDLWSYAEDEQNTRAVSMGDKQDEKTTAKWIKNW